MHHIGFWNFQKKYMQNKHFFLILSWRDSHYINLSNITELITSNTIILRELNLLTSRRGFIGITKFLWIVWSSLFELDDHLHKFLITDPVIIASFIKSQFTVISSTFSTSPENDKNKGLYGCLGFSTNKGWRGVTH